jgi:hypothetical protein
LPFSDERESPDSQDFCDREPRIPVARVPLNVPLGERSRRHVV